MGKTEWTAAQRAAIDDRGGALLVSAAAGSGKTAVLTERAVRLITDPDNPADADKLLIVTFTNAAAAELRARIGEALLRLSAADPANTALQRQRVLLRRAPICTIDAFCLDLLRSHFEAADIPPDFVTADAGTVASLRSAALGETLEKAYADKNFRAFADLYGKGRSDKAAGETILQVYDFLRALPDYRRRLDDFLAPWRRENGFGDTVWRALLLNEAARAAAAGGGLLSAALNDLRADLAEERVKAADKGKSPADANAKFAEPMERLENAAALFAEIKASAEAGEWEALYDKLTPYVIGAQPLPGLKNMKTRLTGEHKAMVRTRADEAAAIFERITELIPCSEAEAEADRAAALPRLEGLFEAVRDFDERFAEKKREKRVLEFSDFEHEALRLLRDENGAPTALCENVRAGFAAVMVDEYQDTNALQDAIYSCLALPDGSNLFLVGDLKQSIYRFRQADPDIFRKKLEAWPPLAEIKARPRPKAGEKAEGAVLALDSNFRSAPEVVAGVNFIFEQLMTPELGDTAYGEGQRLVCGAKGDYRGSVEAAFLAEDSAEAEAAWTARRIEKLAASGEKVRDGALTRPVRYDDICVLLATRGDFAAYTEALAARGIPACADARDNLLDSPHIRPLIALLRVIDNPAQDIYLAAVMLSPLFGFTDDDLVALRASQSARGGSLYGAVLAAANGAACTGTLAEKLGGFYARLAELRSLARSAPIERLFEEIFASTGYLAVLGAGENGPRRREDAQRFASFCASVGTGGISSLVRAVDAAAEAGQAGAEAAPAAVRAGCVTIMTIHRSKGLQFPVVILADTARKFNAADSRRPLLLHRDYGAGLRLRPEGGEGTYKTAAYAALAETYMREMRSEQMRLLYVALTRAQDKLILAVPLGITKTANPLRRAAAFLAAGAGDTLNSQAGSFADWLRAALLIHPCGGALRALAENRELPFADTEGTISIEVQTEAEEAAVRLPRAAEAAAPDAELTARLLAGFNRRSGSEGLSEIPAKVSVTALVHRAERTSLERPAFLSKDGLTAAEMGTALHSFLEHADFAALAAAKAKGADSLAEAIKAENERQLALRITSPEIASKLDEGRIAAFVNSEAFARITAAERVLREYDFITAVPAEAVFASQGATAPSAAENEQVLVQGIADIVLVYPDRLELLDYKTDRGKSAEQLVREYSAQLKLYAEALNKRFAPKRVEYMGIYSFALGRLAEVK